MAETSTSGGVDREIHLKNSQCKIIEGAARRVYHTTEEALGLTLLRINPHNVQRNLSWVDFLGTKGLAFATFNDHQLTLIVSPSRTRTIHWGRGETHRDLTVKVPTLLIATKLQDRALRKATIWLVKPGAEAKLTAGNTDPALCAFPYGNVYSHGGVCWGSTAIRDLGHPAEVEEAFFNSGFNGDLYYSNYLGVTDGNLADLVKRVGQDLPTPTASHFSVSMAHVAQDLSR